MEKRREGREEGMGEGEEGIGEGKEKKRMVERGRRKERRW